jgi:hypothetical protein
MASMNFDMSTLSNLMSLIDEHKDEFKEGEYLQMCNAMKFLHHQTKHQHTPPRQDTHQPQPQHVPQTTQRPVEIFTNAMAASIIMNTICEIERRLNSNGRVINVDKLKVLRELFAAHSISTQGINARTNGDLVLAMTRRVAHIVPSRTINTMFQQAKQQRIENQRPILRSQIIEQEAKLARLNRFPPEDQYRPENIRL